MFTILAVGILLAGCAGQPASSTPVPEASAPSPTSEPVLTMTPTPTGTMPPIETPTPTAGMIVSSCGLSPIAVPTMAAYPGIDALDKTTGLHVTGHAVAIDLETYRLQVTGLVDRPLSLSYDELRCMPKVTARLSLICPGVFEDTATWSGVPLKYILELAGLQPGAKKITLVAADKYESQFVIQTALEDRNFLAYEWEGQPLPVLHGFPLRAVFPSMPGNKWVKWLLEIKVE